MGNQRYQENKLISCFSCLIITAFLFTQGCKSQLTGKNNQILSNWVQMEQTTDGKKKYPSDAKVIISAPIKVAFPDIDAYRGSIFSQKAQWEGIFFINKKDSSVQFFDTKNKLSEDTK